MVKFILKYVVSTLFTDSGSAKYQSVITSWQTISVKINSQKEKRSLFNITQINLKISANKITSENLYKKTLHFKRPCHLQFSNINGFHKIGSLLRYRINPMKEVTEISYIFVCYIRGYTAKRSSTGSMPRVKHARRSSFGDSPVHGTNLWLAEQVMVLQMKSLLKVTLQNQLRLLIGNQSDKTSTSEPHTFFRNKQQIR